MYMILFFGSSVIIKFVWLLLCFFFQAEDGIRDLVRSRGLGDVYKRQVLNGMAIYGGIIPFGATFLIFSDYMRPAIRLAALMKLKVIYVFTPVSYTHLTLPTSDLV